MNDSIIERASKWGLGNDTGMSSRALCSFMLGYSTIPGSPPADADDRGRCIRLLKYIPEWIPRLHELADREKPIKSLVFGSGGMRTEKYTWSAQIPLIMKEGGFDA